MHQYKNNAGFYISHIHNRFKDICNLVAFVSLNVAVLYTVHQCHALNIQEPGEFTAVKPNKAVICPRNQE